MIVDIYDNVLEDYVAEYIHMAMENLSWKYDYHSIRNKPNLHWHIFAGHNPEQVVKNGYEWLLPIWDVAKIKYNFETKYFMEDFVRLYMNAHTHGIEPHIHKDDGDFTMIYYPRLDWKLEWGGGTFVYDEEETKVDKLAEYKGNRLIVFDAWRPHQAQSVRRECYELRTCIVFKTNKGYNAITGAMKVIRRLAEDAVPQVFGVNNDC